MTTTLITIDTHEGPAEIRLTTDSLDQLYWTGDTPSGEGFQSIGYFDEDTPIKDILAALQEEIVEMATQDEEEEDWQGEPIATVASRAVLTGDDGTKSTYIAPPPPKITGWEVEITLDVIEDGTATFDVYATPLIDGKLNTDKMIEVTYERNKRRSDDDDLVARQVARLLKKDHGIVVDPEELEIQR